MVQGARSEASVPGRAPCQAISLVVGFWLAYHQVHLPAEPVPDGPLSQEIIALSKEYQFCICVGIAEARVCESFQREVTSVQFSF